MTKTAAEAVVLKRTLNLHLHILRSGRTQGNFVFANIVSVKVIVRQRSTDSDSVEVRLTIIDITK